MVAPADQPGHDRADEARDVDPLVWRPGSPVPPAMTGAAAAVETAINPGRDQGLGYREWYLGKNRADAAQLVVCAQRQRRDRPAAQLLQHFRIRVSARINIANRRGHCAAQIPRDIDLASLYWREFQRAAVVVERAEDIEIRSSQASISFSPSRRRRRQWYASQPALARPAPDLPARAAPGARRRQSDEESQTRGTASPATAR